MSKDKSASPAFFSAATAEQTERAYRLLENLWFNSEKARDIADRWLERADREGRFEDMVELIAGKVGAIHEAAGKDKARLSLARKYDELHGTDKEAREFRSAALIEAGSVFTSLWHEESGPFAPRLN